ncbi:hypothetical protein [Citrobacter sp. CK186]|uniref:hypothetical protein n=1 Tax=Citrobacter sp. CK186 TaxID=2985095 RepID=UPI0025761409|nr:hypothetical protein [Citrobacter sp. CK186]MDM3032114.1 hypothetical protein [Citrobacter sp. CK186]
MSNGNSPVFPVAARPACGMGSNGMTYRQHLVAALAPAALTRLFESDDWGDFDDMAYSLITAVDAIIDAEEETAK